MALAADTVPDRAVSGQGVGPSRFRIAPFEPLVITINEQHAQLAPVAQDNTAKRIEHRLGREAAGPRVGAHRDRRALRADILDQRRNEDAGRLSKLS